MNSINHVKPTYFKTLKTMKSDWGKTNMYE